MFGSLSPVWTRLGLHGMDTADPASPKIVHAFLPRDAHGYRIEETWDTLGMRATRSDDTILDGAFVPDRYIARDAAGRRADLFILALFAWALLGFGSIYYGLAQRALRPGRRRASRSKTSLARHAASMAYHPEVQHAVGAR